MMINRLDKVTRAPLGARAYSPNLFGVDDMAAAGIISAGASALGGLFGLGSTSKTNKTNLQIARENNIATEKLWQEEAAFNRDMWNASNEYNTPSAQKQRYLDAGINPAFAMGNINSGSAVAQSAPSHGAMQGATMQPSDYSFIGDSVNGALQQYANLTMNQAMINKTNAEARGAAAEADIAETNAKYQEQLLLGQLGEMTSRRYKTDEDRALAKLQRYTQQAAYNDIVNRYKLENESLEKQMGLADAQIAIFNIQKAAEQVRLNNLPKELALNLALVAEKIATEESMQGVNAATKKNIIQSTLESQAREYGLKIDNRQSERMAELVYRNAIREDTEAEAVHQHFMKNPKGFGAVRTFWNTFLPVSNFIKKR